MKTKFQEMIVYYFNLTGASIPDKDPDLPTRLQNMEKVQILTLKIWHSLVNINTQTELNFVDNIIANDEKYYVILVVSLKKLDKFCF